MCSYSDLKAKQQAEFNDFPMQFAFNNAQFAEGMAKLGLSPSDTDKVYTFHGGGLYLRSDAPRLRELISRHSEERAAAIAGDKTGEGYIYDAIFYELGNHEYVVTNDPADALDALGITKYDLVHDERFQKALTRAMREHEVWYATNG